MFDSLAVLEVLIAALSCGIFGMLLKIERKVTRIETKIGLCKSCPIQGVS